MAKNPVLEAVKDGTPATVSVAKTNRIRVMVLAKAYINGRLYEAGETLDMLWAVNEALPKHLQEVRETKKD